MSVTWRTVQLQVEGDISGIRSEIWRALGGFVGQLDRRSGLFASRYGYGSDD